MKQHKKINQRDILYNYDNLKDYKKIIGKDQIESIKEEPKITE